MKHTLLLSLLLLLLPSHAYAQAGAGSYYFLCPPDNTQTACNGCDCTCRNMTKACKAGQTWIQSAFGYICTGNPLAECMTSAVDNPAGSGEPGEYKKRGTRRSAWGGGPWTGDETPDFIPGPYNVESIGQYRGGQGQCAVTNKDGGEVLYKKCKPPVCAANISSGLHAMLEGLKITNDPAVQAIIAAGQEIERGIDNYLRNTLKIDIDGINRALRDMNAETEKAIRDIIAAGEDVANKIGEYAKTNLGVNLSPVESELLGTLATNEKPDDQNQNTRVCILWRCAADEPECTYAGGNPPQCKPMCYECDTVCSGICDHAKVNCANVDRDLYGACIAHAMREFNRCTYYWPAKHCETYMPKEEECCIRNRSKAPACNLP